MRWPFHSSRSRRGNPAASARSLLSALPRVLAAVALAALLAGSNRLAAQTSTWINTSGSNDNWSVGTNWMNGSVPNGSGATADFSTLTIPFSETVHLDSSFTVGNLLFGDQGNLNSWTVDNNSTPANTLTLAGSGTPSITVNNQTATISAAVAGTQGFALSGGGTLALTGANTFKGGVTINSGATLVAGTTSALGNQTTTLNGGTLQLAAAGSSDSLNGFGTGAGWTVNNDNISSAAFPSSGTLQLTNNGTNQARSAFYSTPLPIAAGTNGFSASFNYNPSGHETAAGFTFVLQGDPRGATALGGVGGNLGYGGGPNSTGATVNGISPSAAFLFNMDPNAGGGIGFVLTTNGATPSNNNTVQYEPTYDPMYGINFNSDPIEFSFSYDPSSTSLVMIVIDEVTDVIGYIPNQIDLVNLLGGTTGYMGFTGSTGAGSSIMQISSFSYSLTGAGPVTYANGVTLSASTSSTIEVDNLGGLPVTVGPLVASSGGASTLNVGPSPNLTPNASYTLTMGAVTLNSNLTLNVANNGTGTGTVFLGAVGGSTGFGLTTGGVGTVVLTAPGTYTGNTTITGGTLSISANADLGNPAASATNLSFSGTGGTLQFTAAFALAASRGVTVNSGATGTFNTGANADSIAGAVSLASTGVLSKVGTGSLELDAPLSLGNQSAIQVNNGTLRLKIASGSPTIGSGATATVAAGATLELAGSNATLGPAVNITNNSTNATTGGLYVSGTNQFVGTIGGTGNTVVGTATVAGSLTAYQIVQNSLTIGSGSTVTLAPSGSGSTTNPAGPNNINFSSALTSLSIASSGGVYTGTLDIGNNGLVIAYGTAADPYGTIDHMIASGYNGGFWTSQPGSRGITSTLAGAGVAMHISTPLNIGLVDFTPGVGNYSNTTFISFEGQTVTTNAILIRLTYMDDVVLAGDMAQDNATSDALLFAANYGSGTTWSVGDLTHDGMIGSDDALLFAANYTVGLPSLDGTTGNSAALGGGLAAVPEPAAALLAACGAIGLGLRMLARLTLPPRRDRR